MKGDSKILKILNSVLKHELTAINQFFLHARMYKNWGLETLNERSYSESITEMKHADKLTGRILFLEGLPNLQALGKLRIGEHVQEMLENDLVTVTETIASLRDAVANCETDRDFVSRELLEEILASEEDYADWLETQLALIEKLGQKNYLQSHV